MSTEGEEIRVQLVRMEGKLDLSNLRHEQTDAWKVTVDQRLHRHGNSIGDLQARFHVQDGERRGIALTAKAIHWVTGGGVVAIGAAIFRYLGV